MTVMHRTRPMAAPGQTSARHLLRAATAELHAHVDARFSGPFEADRAAYGAFLTALATAVPPLERTLEAAGIEQLFEDWPQRRRAGLLALDLADLGLPSPAARVAPAAGSEAHAMGMLYVLEGSRLGGKLLLRRVLGNADPQVRRATRYLAHGSDSALWSSFVGRLEVSEAVNRAPDEAIAGAREAFSLFMADVPHA